jgi:hypothetical protein
MPSENTTAEGAVSLVDRALGALAPRVDAFHTAVATAEEEVRTYVTHRRGATAYRTEQTLVELGPFAIGRIDSDRFSTLLLDPEELTPDTESVLDRADQILAGFAAEEDLYRVLLEPGGDLRDAVKAALDGFGQVFGAARAVELARAGVFDPEKHNRFLSSLPFRKWHRAERQLAPPLVVHLDADDLLPAGLGEFLDGQVKIVLVVRGLTSPAPLARLITPGTYVVQTADPADLESLAHSPHPGVGLLFDEEREAQARFVHDPDAGDAAWQRLELLHLPDAPTVGRGKREPRWVEELSHLGSLAAKPAGASTGLDAAVEAVGAADEPVAPADQLAAWLLSQTDLSGA